MKFTGFDSGPFFVPTKIPATGSSGQGSSSPGCPARSARRPRASALAAGRTAILISHRFSTVRMADTIYVLEQGRISERGSHEELLRLGGLYKQLHDAQTGSPRPKAPPNPPAATQPA